MRAWIISDIHLKQREALDVWMPFPTPDADIAIVAGDVCDGYTNTIHWLGNGIAQKMPVYLVVGNHDCYGTSIDRALSEIRFLTRYFNIHLLENDVVELDGLRLIGSTLWTDFKLRLEGRYAWKTPEECLKEAFHVVPRELKDFMEIYRSDERQPGETGFITVQEMIRRHEVSRAFINEALTVPFAGKTIVVTHHAPSIRSVHPDYKDDITSTAFASDLTGMITEREPDIWIHGHVHHFLDYEIAKTRILCNPKGGFGTKSGFLWDFVVNI